MAVYKLFAEKDAAIYSQFPAMNTGIDEIIEASTVSTLGPGDAQVSRFLIQFPEESIENVIDNYAGGGAFQARLRTFMATVRGLNATTVMEVYPVGGDGPVNWANGTGRYLDSPQTDNGVSWDFVDYSGSVSWIQGGFPQYVTGSWSGSSPGGGNWFTGSALGLNVVHTASFTYRSNLDLNVDVTNTILTWYSQSKGLTALGFPNSGFIVKQRTSDEFSALNTKRTEFKFFSTDTNTIYPPQLEIKWDDYSYNTGSSTYTTIDTSQLVASLPNNTNTYFSESIQRFRVNVRPKYPVRSFTTSSLYTANYYLPTTSYYAIKDLDTDEYVIDFDGTYTRISADSNSSYFDIYMAGLQPERYYKILIKTTVDGSTMVLDDNYYFKVVNG